MRDHGTYVKYVVELCRCPECRAANSAYERRRKRENAQRRWGVRPPIFVDAAPVREWLYRLSAAGIGPLQIEQLAGVGKTAQWKIRSRRVKRCLPQTRDAILGVGTDDHVFMRSKIDSTRAREIVAELQGLGMAKAHIAKALGYCSPCLQIATKSTCTLRSLRRLEKLYSERAGHPFPNSVPRRVKHMTSLDPEPYEVEVFGPRRCPHCERTLPANTDYFASDRNRDDGLTLVCSRCRNADGKALYARRGGRPAPMPR